MCFGPFCDSRINIFILGRRFGWPLAGCVKRILRNINSEYGSDVYKVHSTS